MAKKLPLRLITVNIFLFGLLFSAITFNKEIVRPLWGTDPVLGILTGSFPNFIAAFIISLSVVNAVLLRNPKHGRLFISGSATLVFAILTVEELRPMWGASTHYDPWDILGSGIGSLFTILTFETILYFRKNRGTTKHPGEDRGAG